MEMRTFLQPRGIDKFLNFFNFSRNPQPASASTSTPSIPELKQIRDTIYEFYKPSDDSKVEMIFIIFFHDIHWTEYEVPYVQTWMSRCGKICWPQTWLTLKHPNAHILSVRYDAGTLKSDTAGRMDLFQIAENLCHDILGIYVENCPIYLVGHGLGGLVIKALVNKIQEQFNDLQRRVLARKEERKNCIDLRKMDSFLKNVKGVFFYATPFQGIRLVDSTKSLQNRGPLMEQLKRLNEKACRLNEQFRNWRTDSNCKAVAIVAVLPTKVALVQALWYEYVQEYTQVVEEASARYDVDKVYSSGSNHFDVCKPCNENDSSFQMLLELINQNMDSIENPIAKDFEKILGLLKEIELKGLEQGVVIPFNREELERIREFPKMKIALETALAEARLKKLDESVPDRIEIWGPLT